MSCGPPAAPRGPSWGCDWPALDSGEQCPNCGGPAASHRARASASKRKRPPSRAARRGHRSKPLVIEAATWRRAPGDNAAQRRAGAAAAAAEQAWTQRREEISARRYRRRDVTPGRRGKRVQLLRALYLVAGFAARATTGAQKAQRRQAKLALGLLAGLLDRYDSRYVAQQDKWAHWDFGAAAQYFGTTPRKVRSAFIWLSRNRFLHWRRSGDGRYFYRPNLQRTAGHAPPVTMMQWLAFRDACLEIAKGKQGGGVTRIDGGRRLQRLMLESDSPSRGCVAPRPKCRADYGVLQRHGPRLFVNEPQRPPRYQGRRLLQLAGVDVPRLNVGALPAPRPAAAVSGGGARRAAVSRQQPRGP